MIRPYGLDHSNEGKGAYALPHLITDEPGLSSPRSSTTYRAPIFIHTTTDRHAPPLSNPSLFKLTQYPS